MNIHFRIDELVFYRLDYNDRKQMRAAFEKELPLWLAELDFLQEVEFRVIEPRLLQMGGR
jgi:hypothetical protein